MTVRGLARNPEISRARIDARHTQASLRISLPGYLSGVWLKLLPFGGRRRLAVRLAPLLDLEIVLKCRKRFDTSLERGGSKPSRPGCLLACPARDKNRERKGNDN